MTQDPPADPSDAAPAIRLEVLPASYGDCLLVTCPLPEGRVWRMLVDTGPARCWPMLRERLAELPRNADGHRTIDLFIVSHIDHDHIGGVDRLLADGTLDLRFGDIWFNVPRLSSRSVNEGIRLGQTLGAPDGAWPWNAAWPGKVAAVPAVDDPVQIPAPDGWPVLTVLAPSPDRLAALATVWQKELAKMKAGEHESEVDPEPAGRDFGPPDLEQLAARPARVDTSVPNGSSIALLLEHRGARVLLGADALAPDLTAALTALQARRGQAGQPMRMDAFKLAHHGSRVNINDALLDAVEASAFIVSTDNTHFGHPDQEAMARVILRGRRPTIWFNHDTAKNRAWGDEALIRRHGHAVKWPDEGARGVTLELRGNA